MLVVRTYGAEPVAVCRFIPWWDELMHWLYLPVRMISVGDHVRLPENVEFARPAVEAALTDAAWLGWDPKFTYLTMRRGWASTGNPLNRPGWHSDGFGTDDLNYIWTDRFPTELACHDFGQVSDDHAESLEQFADRAHVTGHVETGLLYRFDQHVIHRAPEHLDAGGMRSFLKVSLSDDRYNLVGNSHNHLFDYSWRMWERGAIRNDPAYAGGDKGPQANEGGPR